MVGICYLRYIVHQHILNSRFQGDWWAWAATARSLHSQLHRSSFSKHSLQKVKKHNQKKQKKEEKPRTKK